MKRFTVPANFNGVSHPFHVYIGAPCAHLNPLHFQTRWLKEMRGGDMPQDVLDSFSKLLAISIENNVSFEDLCVYALGAAAEEAASDAEKSPEASCDDRLESTDNVQQEIVVMPDVPDNS